MTYEDLYDDEVCAEIYWKNNRYEPEWDKQEEIERKGGDEE